MCLPRKPGPTLPELHQAQQAGTLTLTCGILPGSGAWECPQRDPVLPFSKSLNFQIKALQPPRKSAPGLGSPQSEVKQTSQIWAGKL